MADAPDIFGKQYILTAGPTPLPPAVSQVMAEPILYHRAPAFVEIYARVLERLPSVFQTRNQVLCFAATGTGAMESAVANLVVPGEPAIVAACGEFGQRWASPTRGGRPQDGPRVRRTPRSRRRSPCSGPSTWPST